MKIIIDGSKMNSKDGMYDEISTKLNLPNYFGRNLDALWDMLSGFVDSEHIVWKNFSKSVRALEGYAFQALSVFEETKAEGYIEFTLEDGEAVSESTDRSSPELTG